jgi:hypothetical protein
LSSLKVRDVKKNDLASGAVDLANADATTNTNKANGARVTARL